MINPQEFAEFMEMYQAFKLFKQMEQPNPDPVQSSAPVIPNQQQIMAQSNAAATASVQEIADLKAEIESLKSQLAAVQSELSTTKSELSTTKSQLASSQAQVKTLTEKTSNLSNVGKKMEQVPEGQLTLEDEIKYQERHGAEGHDSYKRIMDQLSEEDRDLIRNAAFLDSSGVFDVDLEAVKTQTKFMDVVKKWYPAEFEGTPEFKARQEKEAEVNEFGF